MLKGDFDREGLGGGGALPEIRYNTLCFQGFFGKMFGPWGPLGGFPGGPPLGTFSPNKGGSNFFKLDNILFWSAVGANLCGGTLEV